MASDPLSPQQVRAGFVARMRERAGALEEAVLARVYGVSDPAQADDPGYVAGLREAVGVALEYGIAGIEAGADDLPAIPETLLDQARTAARNGVTLDTVLRRYFAGYALLGEFTLQEVEGAGGLSGADLQSVLRAVSAVFDRLLAAVARAYTEEANARFETAERRQVERVKRLLAGELLDSAELRYELDAWHLAAIASGPGAVESLREIAATLECRLLLVRPDPETVWAWLGGVTELSTQEVLRLARRSLPEGVSIALGESGEGIDGWRLTHRQAKAAGAVAQRGADRHLRYADVALLASALGDEVLAGSLHDLYLKPLEAERDGGTLIDTLHTYFAAGRNASSAAALLGVNRNTVSIRLRSAEERIGLPLDACTAELETALKLRDLDRRPGA